MESSFGGDAVLASTKTAIVLLITLALLVSARLSRGQGVLPDTVAPQAEVTLRNPRYCRGGEGDGVLQLESVIRFTNSGQIPIILPEGASIPKWAIADSPGELENPKQVLLDDDIFASGPRLRPGRQPGRGFVILGAGQVFETLVPVGLPYAIAPTEGFSTPGSHFLKLWIAISLDENDRSIARLRERWKKSGYLWVGTVTSPPIPVTIDRNPKIEDCSLPSRKR